MVPVDVKQLISKQSISQKYKSVIVNNIKSIRINTDFRMSGQCVTFLQMTQVTSIFNGRARSFDVKITVEILFWVLKNIQNLCLNI